MKEKETNKPSKSWKHSFYMIQYTVKARYKDTRLIRDLIITTSLLCPWGGGGSKPSLKPA